MPTYEYRCLECKEYSEVTRRMSEPEKIPFCTHGHEMTKHYRSFGISFNGPGFYKTDNV